MPYRLITLGAFIVQIALERALVVIIFFAILCTKGECALPTKAELSDPIIEEIETLSVCAQHIGEIKKTCGYTPSLVQRMSQMIESQLYTLYKKEITVGKMEIGSMSNPKIGRPHFRGKAHKLSLATHTDIRNAYKKALAEIGTTNPDQALLTASLGMADLSLLDPPQHWALVQRWLNHNLTLYKENPKQSFSVPYSLKEVSIFKVISSTLPAHEVIAFVAKRSKQTSELLKYISTLEETCQENDHRTKSFISDLRKSLAFYTSPPEEVSQQISAQKIAGNALSQKLSILRRAGILSFSELANTVNQSLDDASLAHQLTSESLAFLYSYTPTPPLLTARRKVMRNVFESESLTHKEKVKLLTKLLEVIATPYFQQNVLQGEAIELVNKSIFFGQKDLSDPEVYRSFTRHNFLHYAFSILQENATHATGWEETSNLALGFISQLYHDVPKGHRFGLEKTTIPKVISLARALDNRSFLPNLYSSFDYGQNVRNHIPHLVKLIESRDFLCIKPFLEHHKVDSLYIDERHLKWDAHLKSCKDYTQAFPNTENPTLLYGEFLMHLALLKCANEHEGLEEKAVAEDACVSTLQKLVPKIDSLPTDYLKKILQLVERIHSSKVLHAIRPLHSSIESTLPNIEEYIGGARLSSQDSRLLAQTLSKASKASASEVALLKELLRLGITNPTNKTQDTFRRLSVVLPYDHNWKEYCRGYAAVLTHVFIAELTQNNITEAFQYIDSLTKDCNETSPKDKLYRQLVKGLSKRPLRYTLDSLAHLASTNDERLWYFDQYYTINERENPFLPCDLRVEEFIQDLDTSLKGYDHRIPLAKAILQRFFQTYYNKRFYQCTSPKDRSKRLSLSPAEYNAHVCQHLQETSKPEWISKALTDYSPESLYASFEATPSELVTMLTPLPPLLQSWTLNTYMSFRQKHFLETVHPFVTDESSLTYLLQHGIQNPPKHEHNTWITPLLRWLENAPKLTKEHRALLQDLQTIYRKNKEEIPQASSLLYHISLALAPYVSDPTIIDPGKGEPVQFRINALIRAGLYAEAAQVADQESPPRFFASPFMTHTPFSYSDDIKHMIPLIKTEEKRLYFDIYTAVLKEQIQLKSSLSRDFSHPLLQANNPFLYIVPHKPLSVVKFGLDPFFTIFDTTLNKELFDRFDSLDFQDKDLEDRLFYMLLNERPSYLPLHIKSFRESHSDNKTAPTPRSIYYPDYFLENCLTEEWFEVVRKENFSIRHSIISLGLSRALYQQAHAKDFQVFNQWTQFIEKVSRQFVGCKVEPSEEKEPMLYARESLKKNISSALVWSFIADYIRTEGVFVAEQVSALESNPLLSETSPFTCTTKTIIAAIVHNTPNQSLQKKLEYFNAVQPYLKRSDEDACMKYTLFITAGAITAQEALPLIDNELKETPQNLWLIADKSLCLYLMKREPEIIDYKDSLLPAFSDLRKWTTEHNPQSKEALQKVYNLLTSAQ